MERCNKRVDEYQCLRVGAERDRGPCGDVFLSANNAASWSAANTGITNNSILSLASGAAAIFAGTGDGVFISTNNGTSWTAASQGLTNKHINALLVNGNTVFAGTSGGGAFVSGNNGTSWSLADTASLKDFYVNAFFAAGSNVYAGNGAGVFVTSNNGASWTSKTAGLTSLSSADVFGFALKGTTLYAGTGIAGVFKMSVAPPAPPTFAPAPGVLPMAYELRQNYPNPFNPSTVINYSIASASNVTLKVYDLLGREVAVLVNQQMAPGTYTAVFNASRLSSGVYFYRLDAGSFTDVKKLSVAK